MKPTWLCAKESVQSFYTLGSPKDGITMACYIRFIFNTEIYNDNLKGKCPGGWSSKFHFL